MKSYLLKLAVVGSISATLAGAAAGHEFTAAILVTGQEREARLAEAVNGFLLAADERDAEDAAAGAPGAVPRRHAPERRGQA